MQASSFGDPIAGFASKDNFQTELTTPQKLLFLVLNFIPLLHISAMVFLVSLSFSNWFARGLLAVTALYLLPALVAVLIRKLCSVPEGRITCGSKPFFVWWSLLQLQMIFCRLPILEELLRLVPGAYSAWLRLWGARIGRLTFWSPGTIILDRSYLQVGDDVVFGAGVRINPHVIAKNEAGDFELLLGKIKVGDGVRVGGYSLLTAGAEIVPGEVTDAVLVLPPFSIFKDGKRIRPKHDT